MVSNYPVVSPADGWMDRREDDGWAHRTIDYRAEDLVKRTMIAGKCSRSIKCAVNVYLGRIAPQPIVATRTATC